MAETEALDLVDFRREEVIKTWDFHCSYQWTYFPEEAKQLIQFFLSNRIHRRNLDLGAGWYTYHPNSTVVDLSLKGLEYNSSKEKVFFDLDDVARGKLLPFPDNSFGSATLVSVWQYLRHGKVLLGELERVLLPGSEVFIINESGAALTSMQVGPSSPKAIEQEVKEAGYDCIRETIPFGDPSFQSVTVAMPYYDLFGKQACIKDKLRKLEENKERAENPASFYDDFALWETSRAALTFQRLGNYPITKFSQEYQQRLEEFSDALYKKTGKTALIFMEHDILPDWYLATSYNRPRISFASFSQLRKNRFDPGEDVQQLLEESGFIDLAHHLGCMGVASLDELDDKLQKFPEEPDYRDERNTWESDLGYFTIFLGSIPLTEQTEALQRKVYGGLKTKIKDLDERIMERQMLNAYLVGCECKQRRRIDKLIASKERILAEGMQVIGYARFNHLEILDYYKNRVREDLDEAIKNWPPSLSDD